MLSCGSSYRPRTSSQSSPLSTLDACLLLVACRRPAGKQFRNSTGGTILPTFEIPSSKSLTPTTVQVAWLAAFRASSKEPHSQGKALGIGCMVCSWISSRFSEVSMPWSHGISLCVLFGFVLVWLFLRSTKVASHRSSAPPEAQFLYLYLAPLPLPLAPCPVPPSRKEKVIEISRNCSGAGSAAPRSTNFGQFVKAVSEEARDANKNGRMPGGAGRRTSTSFEAINASSATGIPNLVR